ncbi:NCS2 family permease [Brevibacillus fulvus]|uniref:AGZA family xanthine/uracil permease-like MFS transporter n=2 Tax=Brevibacillus fulvus TaxID=1125967 RepID=A0A938XTL4_9BACL|nr:NCS2 family permease [Brevibacillus fulvus]MBM7590243.1 AGZA family xanthine/uracil permease-like MFS transporter [Brevibacillus fulvus]
MRTAVNKELLAGLTSYFTSVYVIVVNAIILADAGIPLEAGITATALTAFVGCLLMAFWAKAPVILVPGMGINAFFTYTVVRTMGLSWQEALAAVFLSGLIFCLIAFTKLAQLLSQAIPASLKEAISVGIGLFLIFIGLQKGGIIVNNESTFVALGDLGSLPVLVTVIGLVLNIVLHVKNIKGSFLIGIVTSSLIAWLFGLIDLSGMQWEGISFTEYSTVVGSLSFADLGQFGFWMATFSFTMVIVFENMGLLHSLLEDKQKFSRAYQANAISVMGAGLLGSSPTVSAVESAAGIAAGGKTGTTAITTGLLFLLTLFFIPVIKMIPDQAVAPVLIIIGGLMVQNIRHLPLQDFSQAFPAILIIALIPLTYSIVDGIGFGFIAYVLIQFARRKVRELPLTLIFISALFLLNFIVQA